MTYPSSIGSSYIIGHAVYLSKNAECGKRAADVDVAWRSLGGRAALTGELWFCRYHDDGTSGDVRTCSDRFGNLFMGDGVSCYAGCVDSGLASRSAWIWGRTI